MPASDQVLRVAVRRFGPFEAAIAASWKSFRRASGCRLRLEAVPLDLPELHAALLGGGGLRRGEWDIGLVVTDWLAEARAGGALRDLAARLRTDPPEGHPCAWTESLRRHQSFGREVLGLPYHDGPECLIYRTDLVDRPPRTWEEFRTAARRLSDPARRRWGTVFAGFPDGHNTVYDFCLQLWSRGGELFTRQGRVQLATPEAEAALEFYRELRADPAAHPESARMDSVQSGEAFARGEVALMVNWFGFAALGETQEGSAVRGKVGVAPVPAGPGGRSVSLNVYWLLGIGAGSAHPEEAYAFLRHCAGPEADRNLTLGGGIGCRRSTWSDPAVREAIPFFGALEELHAGTRELPRLPRWPELAAVLDRLVTRTAETRRPVAELLAEAQAQAAGLGLG